LGEYWLVFPLVLLLTLYRPATQFLKESKGAPSLEKDGSIKVDEHFQIPSLPGCYAIGDVATYPYGGQDVRIEHWNVAQNAGRQVARDITGQTNHNMHCLAVS